jgi:hypothetical protein
MSQLFNPFKVRFITLSHRVVMAPMTRFQGYEVHTRSHPLTRPGILLPEKHHTWHSYYL